jgi:hypothetical protein
VPLKLTEKNARKICELAGRPDIKVYAGAIRPLMRELVTAEEVHGKTGLNGPRIARTHDEAAGAVRGRLHRRDAYARRSGTSRFARSGRSPTLRSRSSASRASPRASRRSC